MWILRAGPHAAGYRWFGAVVALVFADRFRVVPVFQIGVPVDRVSDRYQPFDDGAQAGRMGPAPAARCSS